MCNRFVLGVLIAVVAMTANARTVQYLVKFQSENPTLADDFLRRNGGEISLVSREGALYLWTSSQDIDISWDANVHYVQKNQTYGIFQSPSLVKHRASLIAELRRNPPARVPRPEDNPAIKEPVTQASGADPMLDKAWGIFKVGADKAWKNTSQGKDIVVAVTDTGVDYNHADLINNMWRNKGEIADNAKDDDNNGYVDDIVGYDFAANDNKPFDLTLSLMEILFQGGNPGHGTHVSGVVGARMNNSVGVAGVAPQVKIMAVRFITEKGQGDTASAVKSIDYAVNNGAHIINASWGSEAGDEDDSALREAIQRAEAKGVIFVAAAGNGRVNQATMTAAGFDNDSDSKPMVPASYPYKNMVAVAATDDKDALAGFSNWGQKSVKLGAPGVKIMSTVPGSKYQDTVVDLGGMKATWDGTSMAAPFVSGALAVLWSQHKEMGATTAPSVIDALLSLVHQVDGLKTKVSSGGRLDIAEATRSR